MPSADRKPKAEKPVGRSQESGARIPSTETPDAAGAPPEIPAEPKLVEYFGKMMLSDRAERLASCRKKWLQGHSLEFFRKLPQQDLLDMGVPHSELRAADLLRANVGENLEAVPLPLECSQRDMAKIINEKFGTKIDHQDLGKLKKGEDGKPLAWAVPCFNANNGRWKPAVTLRQWELHMGGKEVTASEQENRRRILAADADDAEMRRDERKRKFDARWTLMEVLMFLAEGFWTIIRQLRIAQKKKSLDNARAAGKAAGIDDAALERQQVFMRDLEEADYAAWQNELDGDPNVPGSIGKLGELEKAARELSDAKKAELKVKV